MGMAPKYLNRDVWTLSLNVFEKCANCAGAKSGSLERIVADQDEKINGLFYDGILKPIFLHQGIGGGNFDGIGPLEIENDSKSHDS